MKDRKIRIKNSAKTSVVYKDICERLELLRRGVVRGRSPGSCNARDSPSCVGSWLSPKRLRKKFAIAIHWAGESPQRGGSFRKGGAILMRPCSSGAVPVLPPDSEVVAKAKRRVFTAAYKLRIVK